MDKNTIKLKKIIKRNWFLDFHGQEEGLECCLVPIEKKCPSVYFRCSQSIMEKENSPMVRPRTMTIKVLQEEILKPRKGTIPPPLFCAFKMSVCLMNIYSCIWPFMTECSSSFLFSDGTSAYCHIYASVPPLNTRIWKGSSLFCRPRERSHLDTT